jgi:glycosyltransferase involved in cell wall biosynthesis
VNRTRLAIVIPSLDTGGTERQVVLLTTGIAEADPALLDELTVITMRRGGTLEHLLPAGIRLRSLGVRRLYSPLTLWRLVRELRTLRPDTVYSLLVPANLLCALASWVVPTHLYWGHRSQHFSMGAPRWMHRAVALLLRATSSRIAGVVVNSHAAAAYLAGIGIAGERVRVVHNAVDLTEFRPDHGARLEGRAELGAGQDDTVVLSVGRLVADKDHPTLLRAFAEVSIGRPGCRLLVIGGGSPAAADELRRLADELGIATLVTLFGVTGDLNRWYNAADVMVQSSINEGQSNVLIEALAAGCRSVSTDCGDASSLLPADCVVAVGDPAALAAAIVGALALPPQPARLAPTTPSQLAIETLSFIDVAHTETELP